MSKRATLEEAEVRVRELGRVLKGVMPEGWGFVLILSSFHEKGFATYVSSVEREGAVEMIRDMADKIERGEPDV